MSQLLEKPSATVSYVASPTLSAFHRSAAFVRGVMGPLGSGKSSAMCVELLSRGLAQSPDAGGRRRSRFAVVRNTYPELKTTTVKTWLDWTPEGCRKVTWGAPVVIRHEGRLTDGTRLDCEVLFLALDAPGDARKLLSLELTGAWVNEAREVPREIVDALTGRVGRYPPKRQGGPDWSGIVMDTNPPEEDHWWRAADEIETPAGWEFFRQPPAVVETPGAVGNAPGGWRANPLAENACNQPLGFDYWLRQAAGKSRRWVQVYLQGRYGSVESGRAVFPEFDEAEHVRAVQPLPGRPLVLGWDFGLTPALAVCQLQPGPRLAVLAEVTAESMGVRRFARELVRPLLDRRFPGMTVESWGDPAGRSRAQTDERTCMDELAAAGLPTRPARTNDFTARREAVAGFLSAPGGFVIDPGCRTLVQGFVSGYRFGRVALPGEARYRDSPEKNRFSHVHDALQYASLAAEARLNRKTAACQAGERRSRKAPAPADQAAGY